MLFRPLLFALICLLHWPAKATADMPHAPIDPEEFSGRVFIVGDSTASAYEPRRYPRMGWAQVLDTFYDQRVTIFNLAKPGRSTKSYISEGYFDALKIHLMRGDIVIIQFGHNDGRVDKPNRYAPADGLYQELLKRYIRVVREKGATPLLFTSVARRKWQEGALTRTLTPYIDAMKKVSIETGTQLVDMNAFTRDLVIQYGEEGSKDLYLHLKKGATPLSKQQEVSDDTHFSEKGAYLVAAFAATALNEAGLKPFKIK